MLDSADVELLRAADTIFLGSFHAAKGADATHRGGDAEFVRVVDEHTITIPDYAGNAMFNPPTPFLADS